MVLQNVQTGYSDNCNVVFLFVVRFVVQNFVGREVEGEHYPVDHNPVHKSEVAQEPDHHQVIQVCTFLIWSLSDDSHTE